MFCIQVDAGFFMAAAANQVNESPDRANIEANYGGLCAALVRAAVDHHGDPSKFLRLYWYDASHNGTIDAEHALVAELPGVKVVLGRMVHGQQKGVDTRICADMMQLASTGNIDTFYILTGDEDIVVPIEIVQHVGCRVVLIKLDILKPSRQLINAVDESVTLPPDVIEKYVIRVKGTLKPFDAGARFAALWIESADPDLLEMLRKQTTLRIPQEVDSVLLREANDMLGGEMWDINSARESVRAGFWSVVRPA